MNKVILVGRLCADPEMRTTQSGVSNCTFRIAVNRRFKNANGTYDADFINCVAWRATADFIHKFFIKGNMIGVEGTWQTRTYEAQDGSKRTANECVVENAEFVGSKGDNGGHAAATAAQSGFEEVEDDGLPF